MPLAPREMRGRALAVDAPALVEAYVGGEPLAVGVQELL
jgi:hypothetical protein